MASSFVNVANMPTACTTAMMSIVAAVPIATGCLQASSKSLGETTLTSPDGVVAPPGTAENNVRVRVFILVTHKAISHD